MHTMIIKPPLVTLKYQRAHCTRYLLEQTHTSVVTAYKTHDAAGAINSTIIVHVRNKGFTEHYVHSKMCTTATDSTN